MARIGAVEESEPWEKAKLGETIGQRLGNIFKDSDDWRRRAGYEKTHESIRHQRVFNQQLSTWGKHVLQMQTVDEYKGDVKKIEKLVQNEIQQGQEARKRLKMRKKVRVADLENDDNNLSLKLDKEWSTTGWPKEDIEDAVRVMFEIFYGAAHSSEQSKKLACNMLVKLINRHDEAMVYVKKNIGQLAGLAASRFIRGGQSAGVLDLLHIVNSCKDKFIFELSECMFTVRAHDMIAIEMRLAAMLIQHMVRSHQLFKKRERRVVNPITKEFGTDEEFYRDQMRNIIVRRADLKARWRSMHAFMKPQEVNINIGLRAPSYLRKDFTLICLEITQELVSDRAGKYANSNREDVLRANGPIFYTQVLGTCVGPFVFRALSILSQVSKMPESLAPLLHAGCVTNVIKYMQFMLDTNKAEFVTSLRVGHSSTWNECEEVLEEQRNYKFAFFDCIQILANLASHAAGVHRADRGFNYARRCPIIQEDINYMQLKQDVSMQYTGKPLKVPLLHESYIIALFCSERCIGMLSMLIRETTNLNVARNALRAFYGLCCSAGMRPLIQELVMEGGRTLARILELVEEEDQTVHSLCLCLLLQATTMDYARSQLFFAHIPRLLSSYLTPTTNYHRQAYQRYILIASSLLRQQDWRAYEPVYTARHFADNTQGIRLAAYLDLLKTIKNVPVSDTLESEHLTVADLVIMPTHEENSRGLAIIAEELGARAIADFVSHPHDGDFFVSLEWAESVAGCQILEALCCGHVGTMQDVYSVGLAHYLGKCLHLSRFLFDPAKPPLAERMLMLVLNGVRSAANSLAAICRHIYFRPDDQDAIILGIRHSDVLGAAQFFVSSLTAQQHILDAPLVRLQQTTGMKVASFYTEYLRMLGTLPDAADPKLQSADPQLGRKAPLKVSKRLEELIRELEPMGEIAVKQVKGLVSTLGNSPASREILNVLCTFLLELVKPAVFSDIAIHQWHIFEALENNLPRPLAAVGDPDINDPRYIEGLGYLPVSFLHLVTTLNQLDQGALHTLNFGFLRRALEKLRLLVLKGVLTDANISVEERDEHRHHAAGCLRLIASVGTFSKEKGGSANNLILREKYRIVETCKSILSYSADYRDGGYKCDEPIIIAALATLGRLSEDNFSVTEIFEKFDILGEAGKQMMHVGMMPRSGIIHCLEIVHNISTLRTDYVTKLLPSMETPIQKVNRVLPELNQIVIDLTWKIAVRLNSFDDSQVEPGGDQVFHHRDFYAQSDKAHQKLFTMDRILARQLEKIYDEANIPQSERGFDPETGNYKELNKTDESKNKGASASEYVSPLSTPPFHKDSKEWHNPTYDTAKITSSPTEVRNMNFRVDSAFRRGDEQSVGTAHTLDSPFTVHEFQASSIADAHRGSPDAVMKYLMSYPVNQHSPLPSPIRGPDSPAFQPSRGSYGSSVISPLSGHSTPSTLSPLPSMTPLETPASPDRVSQHQPEGMSSPGASTPSAFSDQSRTLASSITELPPLDSPASVHSPSPSHSAPSSPLKASHKQAHKNNVDSLPSPSTAGRPKKSGKRNGKVKSGVKTEGNIVVMDVDEAPDLMHTRPTKGGFIFTV